MTYSPQAAAAVNMVAGEDLRGDVFELLKLENDSDVAKVIKATAATDVVIGVLAENPRADATTDGETVPVVLVSKGGIGYVKAGDTITAGQLAVSDTDAGRGAGVANIAALAADQGAFGVWLESGSDGDILPVLFQPIAAPHSA